MAEPPTTDPTSLNNPIAETAIPKTRSQRLRKDCLLTQGERNAIARFKEKYRSEVIRERRVALMKSEIMTAYFNYLHQQGQAPKTDEDLRIKTKFLASWIANNWRPKGKSDLPALNINVRAIDLIWRRNKDKCEEELKRLLGVDDLDSSSKEYFQQRMAAAKAVLDRLSVRERAELDAEVAKIRDQGHDKEDQRELAVKYGEKRIATFARERWLEMGMHTFIVSAYTKPDGQLVVTTHDDMAKLSDIGGRLFRDKYRDLVDQLKRSILQYVMMLRDLAEQRDAELEGAELDPSAAFKVTDLGFPILPEPVAWKDKPKKELERVVRTFMSKHYVLASLGQSQVPYKALMEDARSFVEVKYIPRPNIFQDPRNMPKDDLLNLLYHIHNRQVTFGAEDSFRFSHFHKKDKQMREACYPGAPIETERNRRAKPATRKRNRRKGKMKISQLPDVVGGDNTNVAGTSAISHNGAEIITSISEPSGITIDHRQMSILLQNGVTGLSAINGPSDGSPKYHLPSSFLPVLRQLDGENIPQPGAHDENIDPCLIGVSYESEVAAAHFNQQGSLNLQHAEVLAHPLLGGGSNPTEYCTKRANSGQRAEPNDEGIGHDMNGQSIIALGQKPRVEEQRAEPSGHKGPGLETTADGSKRKRTKTADDLAQEEAALLGMTGKRRRPGGYPYQHHTQA